MSAVGWLFAGSELHRSNRDQVRVRVQIDGPVRFFHPICESPEVARQISRVEWRTIRNGCWAIDAFADRRHQPAISSYPRVRRKIRPQAEPNAVVIEANRW